MIKIENKRKCCGCTACASICPQKCIKMLPDEEGFLYPKIQQDKCVDCGACNKVCPVDNAPAANVSKIESYAMRTKEDDVLKRSTSGGFVTPLADWVLQRGGVLCAAAYMEDFTVAHILVDSDNEKNLMPRIRGSKYVQSDLKDCFLQIRRKLAECRLVCFVGTTCQVNGLKAFLGRENDNLITVDLVCHGVPSPKLWKKYLNYQRDKYGFDIVDASFRNKTYGYHGHTMMLKFENGKTYTGSGRVDAMMKSFMCEIASRPICYQCPFKKLNRCSDFTVFDCWHFEELVSGVKDDDRGYTNVFIQSSKGLKVFDEIKHRYEYYTVNLEKAIEKDGKMVLNAARPHKERDNYLITLDQEPLMEHIQRFIPIQKSDVWVERSKKYLYNAKLAKLLKSLRAGKH